MASKEIEKLKDKFDNDPNSKLFLPLAEEYRKEGMLEEAIDVLRRGLEKHHTYTSARVLLGKMYLEKGMMDEARKEFESVTRIVPDNLFAHKKLAELYRDTGETELAIKAFKTILKLNPMDEESLSNLRDIEAALSFAPSAEEPLNTDSSSVEMRMPGTGFAGEEESSETQVIEAVDIAAPDVRVERPDDDLNAFKNSLFGDNTVLDEGFEIEDEIHLETPAEADEAVTAAISESEDELVASGELSFEDIGEAFAQESKPPVRETFSAVEDADETIEFLDEPLEMVDEPVGTAFEQAMPELKKETVDLSAEQAMPELKRETVDLSAADRFIAEGKFVEAMSVYRKFLARDPHDKRILQRVEELRALLKLMGKDKEVLIDKLNSFLEGIHKGRNGFLSHS